MDTRNLLYTKEIGALTVECVVNEFNEDISRFVAEIYYNKPHYNFNEDIGKITTIMVNEDKLYKSNSIVITVYNEHHEIQGTVRKILANRNQMLPIEREFSIDLAGVIKENLPIHNIYEVARFANRDSNVKALKILLSELVGSSNINDLFLASLDTKVLAATRKLGFAWYNIGMSKEYLGSETCPVAVSVSNIGGKFSHERTHNCNYIDDKVGLRVVV
jgi:hypothetical protein